MPVIEIICAADERFALPVAMMLCSVATHCPRPIRAFILNTDLSDASKQKIQRICARAKGSLTIQWLNADQSYLRDQPVGLAHLSQATYLRLALGRMLPAEVTRVIYLDSDVLVIKDLSPLWDASLDGRIAGAVRDFMTPEAGATNAIGYCVEAANIPADHPMFNAGILLIDVDAYRKQQVEADCLAFLNRYRSENRSGDQDALNAVLHDRWKPLDFCWNVQMGSWNGFKTSPMLSAAEQHLLQQTDPAILHFSGSGKPWNSGLRSPYCTLYVDQVGHSGWFSQFGFRLWKGRRLLACVRTIVANRLASLTDRRPARSPA